MDRVAEEERELGVTLQDLGLGLAPVGRGRREKAVAASVLRPLTEADLAAPTVQVQSAPPIKSLRDTHHALARVLATGSSEHEASLITGYTPSRISVLKADPQFQELLEFYREQGTEAVADFRTRMADTGMSALGLLNERMEDAPEEFSPALLKDIVRDMADRTGHAPQRGPQANVQVNVAMTERIREARERVAERFGPTIEHEG